MKKTIELHRENAHSEICQLISKTKQKIVTSPGISVVSTKLSLEIIRQSEFRLFQQGNSYNVKKFSGK